MSTDRDQSEALATQVVDAYEQQRCLAIQGGNSKTFLGETGEGEPLDVTQHRGIVSCDPGELVLTARAGTPLTEIENALAEYDQALPFEPPHFGETATLGGTIATGVSGPARPYTGAARDFVLGARVINGRGQILSFGGEVMKNVAGYDLSRLMAGAFGTLGVLLDISLKVLPRPRAQHTRVFEQDAQSALDQFSRWALKPWPITGAYWEDGMSYIRLAGAETSVDAACTALGGESLDDGPAFWSSVREMQRSCLTEASVLWRLSVPPAASLDDLDNIVAIDWGGAQRWLVSERDATSIREAVSAHAGHATVYRGQAKPRFHPMASALAAVQQRVKESLDPQRILNRGRFYPTL